jgi:arginine decarboxylase
VLPVPSKFDLVVGSGEGATPLNSFDAALLDAGIGNLNLVRVSSILPPGAQFFLKQGYAQCFCFG